MQLVRHSGSASIQQGPGIPFEAGSRLRYQEEGIHIQRSFRSYQHGHVLTGKWISVGHVHDPSGTASACSGAVPVASRLPASAASVEDHGRVQRDVYFIADERPQLDDHQPAADAQSGRDFAVE